MFREHMETYDTMMLNEGWADNARAALRGFRSWMGQFIAKVLNKLSALARQGYRAVMRFLGLDLRVPHSSAPFGFNRGEEHTMNIPTFREYLREKSKRDSSDAMTAKMAKAAGLVKVWKPKMGRAPAAYWWVKPKKS